MESTGQTEFGKSDLKDGDKCVNGNGKEFVVKNKRLLTFKGAFHFDFFQEDLTRHDDPMFSIIRVTRNGVVLFERDKKQSKNSFMSSVDALSRATVLSQLKDNAEVTYRKGLKWFMIQYYSEARDAIYFQYFNEIDEVWCNDECIFKREDSDTVKTAPEQAPFEPPMNRLIKDMEALSEAGNYNEPEFILTAHSRAALQSFPESVQLVIIQALSDEDKRKLIDL